jgi:L-2-hydroxyglutarate oxidase
VFERFTERARQVIVLAHDERRALKHNYIGTEHLLLGLLGEQDGLAARVLTGLGVELQAARARVVEIIGRGDAAVEGYVPFTPRMQKILELAHDESRSLGHNYIGTEHLLLALARENEGVANRILDEFGAHSERIRDGLFTMVTGGPSLTRDLTGASSRGEAALPVRADVVVVGAGILGLATAVELGRRLPDRRVVVVEKEPAIARHQTGRNSCVVHSGVYYAPGSLKAQLCTAGRLRLREYCAEKEIPYDECGKLIVAADAGEVPALDELQRRADANGVPGLRRLAAEEIPEIEPHCVGVAGLRVPTTAIVDFRLVAAALAADLHALGGEVCTDAGVSALRDRGDRVVVETARGSVEADGVVACAGLQSDRLVVASGLEDEDRTAIIPFRGDYYALREEARRFCRTLIYPVPDPRFPFLGVHANRRPDGEVWLGPNAVLALSRDGYGRASFAARDAWDTLSSRAFWRLARRHWRTGIGEVYRDVVPRAFVGAARRYLPELSRADVVPAPAGIRAQAVRSDGTLVDDFLFARSARVLHVKNAPSPGATASLAIGAEIADQALDLFRP